MVGAGHMDQPYVACIKIMTEKFNFLFDSTNILNELAKQMIYWLGYE